ncbi:MAG TPA: hypothetical protein VHH35_13675 [Pyrinomonadaceae bacterium]|nr:hypothetical protein [Pyrinomonadaceae bacterium]
MNVAKRVKRHGACSMNGAHTSQEHPTSLRSTIFTKEGTTKSMMKKTSFAAIFCALALFVAAPLAHATTVTEVQAMIASLKAKTTNVIISGKSAEKDRTGLLDKLNEVSLKVDQAKFCDAIVKVNDFKVRVNHLIAVGRINQDPAAGTTGQELLSDADAIIAGLNDLQVQSTGAACTF